MKDDAIAISAWERLIVNVLDAMHLAHFVLKASRRDLILTYHSVEAQPSGYKYAVNHSLFAQHIDLLQQYFDIVALDRIFAEEPDRRSRVALTFDDAYADFYEYVYPLLRARSLPAIVFVPTGFIGSDEPLLQRDENRFKPHLTWEQMREISASSAISFESHSHAHHSALSDLTGLKVDLQQSIDLLSEEIGARPRYLAYPYGLFNEEANRIALGCGFEKLFTMEDVAPTTGPIQGRLDVYQRNQDLPYFKLAVAGLLGSAVRGRIRRILYNR